MKSCVFFICTCERVKWLAANQCNTFLRACLGCCPCFPEWGSVSLLGCQGLKRYSCLNWKAEVMRRLGPNSHYMRHSPQDKSKNTTLGKTPLDNCSCGFVHRLHVLCTFDDLRQVYRLSKCHRWLCVIVALITIIILVVYILLSTLNSFWG